MELVPALIVFGVVLLVVALAAGLFVSRQRALTQRVGSFVCEVRPDPPGGASWDGGIAQYGTGQLLWWRAFSLSPRPARSWPREGLDLVDRTVLDEVDELGRPMVRARVEVAGTRFQMVLSSAAYSGLVSWLESGPRRVGSVS